MQVYIPPLFQLRQKFPLTIDLFPPATGTLELEDLMFVNRLAYSFSLSKFAEKEETLIVS